MSRTGCISTSRSLYWPRRAPLISCHQPRGWWAFMAVKRRLMIPHTQSHFCCCSQTLPLHSAEVVMKRFTRSYCRESHGSGECSTCSRSHSLLFKILLFLIVFHNFCPVCMCKQPVLCLPSSQFSCQFCCSVLLAGNQLISSLCCVCSTFPEWVRGISVLSGARDLTHPHVKGPQMIAVVLPDHWFAYRMIPNYSDEVWKTTFE